MELVRDQFFVGLQAAAPNMPVGNEEVVALNGAIWRAERMAKSAS
jgi:hypothetical protein